MNKVAFLPLLILPACASPGENARLMQAALDRDKAVCLAHGTQPGTDSYTRCMVKLGHEDRYLVAQADDGSYVFALTEDSSIPREPHGGLHFQAYGGR
jgi:hypothetical protein